ncbi:putative membrane protein [Clostridium beijerinckii]|nr:putative membrane protein [Clostridium beijerinckii]
MNGTFKGNSIELNNTTSFSQVNDLDLKVNDEIFISLQSNDNNEITSAKILDLKRDKYVIYMINIFIALILLVGGIKGFKSLVSVVVNILIVFSIIGLFSKGYDLAILSIIGSILFIIASLFIVSGKNKKTASAIIGTLAGTLTSMLIAGIVIKLNNWSGIHFEEMEFLNSSSRKDIFH